MINPFRNIPVGIHSLSSAAHIAAKVKPLSKRRQFWQRLIQWSKPELTGTRVKSADPAATARLEDGFSLKRGHSLLRQGDIAGAIEQYQQAIAHHPTSEAYQYLAEALSQQGQLEAAAFSYRQAIDLLEDGIEPLDMAVVSTFTAGSPAGDIAVDQSTVAQATDSASDDRPNSAGISRTKEIPWFEQASFHLQQAIVNCNSGDWQEATTACQASLERLEPEAATAYLTLGRSLQAQANLAAAEQAYCKSLALQPSAEAHARLGSLYSENQRFSEAAQQYQTAIQLEPTFAGAYWKLADVWQQLNQEAEAVFCLYQTFRLQPDWATLSDFCDLADRCLALGNLEQAEDCYNQALKLDPKTAVANWGMGAVQQQRGDQQSAINYYRQAMLQSATNSDLAAKLATALTGLRQWEDALICYQHWSQLVPGSIAALVGLQTCHMQLERWSEALPVSQALTQLEPHQFNHWHHLGDVKRHLHQSTEAATAYQKSIELNPDFSWSHNNLGDVLLQLNQWQSAAVAFQAAIRLRPEFVWSHYNLGEAFVQLQDWDNAIVCYRNALKLQPDLPHAAKKLADVLRYRAAVDREDALTFYQQEIQQNPTDPDPYHKALELQPDAIDLYLGLADALIANDRWDEALVCCQIGRQLEPENTELIARLKHILQQREFVRQPQNQQDYETWIAKHTPTATDLNKMAIEANTFDYQPLISIIMPVYDTPELFLRTAIQSVLNQVYPNWQLCIADDASTDLAILELLNQLARQDARIKVVFRPENGHIAAASNSALSLATGEFVVLLDHDDTLAPEALYEVVALLNQHPTADMIYSDEDKLDLQGKRVQPFFKPDWCPDSFLSRMYTCHLGVYRRQLIEEIGGFRLGYEGSQDYDLVLRLTEKTDSIFHIPKVLYHWRIHTDSTASSQTLKPYAIEAAKLALSEACDRRGEPVKEIVVNPNLPGVYIPRYQITEFKPVSIIIPTRNLGKTLDRCLQSIFQKTTYPNYEVILIDNGSHEAETLRVIEQWQKREFGRFRSYLLDIPFNYSTLNNYGCLKSTADYLLFLNNDVEVITPDWIEAMVEQAQRPSIGAVGSLLLYPDRKVQHAGVVLGIGGIAGHSHKYFAVNDCGYFSQLVSVNNYSAVTAACLMCRREVFEQVKGFDESLAVAFNDVDFCLKIQQLGYRNLSLPHAVLYHHESHSRGPENTLEKQNRFNQELRLMQERWKELIDRDPCYSPHLTLAREDFSLSV